MTVRAILLGLIGALFIGAIGYLCPFFNLPPLTRGHLPIMIFAMLFVVMCAVNPLLTLAHRRWRLLSIEIALAMAMMLVACNIPSSGLMRHFSSLLVMPGHLNATNPGWRKNAVLSYAPPSALVAGGRNDARATDGYLTGLGDSEHSIALDQVPWDLWLAPLATWLPLVLLCALAVICLSVVVHPQWADREKLRYPIAELSTLLMAQEDGSLIGPLFRNKLFWVGAITVLAIRLCNLLYLWFPEHFMEIPLELDFTPLGWRYPYLQGMPDASFLLRPLIIPTAIGFTFFLALDISFSMALTGVLTPLILWAMVGADFDISGTFMGGGLREWQGFGSFLGYALILIYIGRRYYWDTLVQAVTGIPRSDVTPAGLWACRGLILVLGGMVLLLTRLGLDWPLAILVVGLTMLLFLVLARINAECGVFFFKPSWAVPGVLVGLFGSETLGPGMILIIGMVYIVLSSDPFEALIPYVTNGLRITSWFGGRPGRVGLSLAATFAITLAVAIPVGLWADYNYGKGVPEERVSEPFNATDRVVTQLSLVGQLNEVVNWTSVDRLAHMRPSHEFLVAAGVGFVLILIIARMRLRYAWWPIHPIILLGLGTWSMEKFGFSFFLGWLGKLVVMKIGGPKSYYNARYLMVGVIAGDLLGGLLYMATNYAYWLVTGLPGKTAILW
ncbi:MAG: DUF6785 family protein [Phycisphaerae bacterium]